MMVEILIHRVHIGRVSFCLLLGGLCLGGMLPVACAPVSGARGTGSSRTAGSEKTIGADKQTGSARDANTSKAITNFLYGQIAEDGLSGTISSGNLSVVKSACDEEHSDPDGKNWCDDIDAGVPRLFKYMDRETAKILNLSANSDTNSDDRAKLLHHFGLVLRGLEEFYMRSNYLELKIENSDKQIDPYNVEPINWTKLGKDARSIAMTGFKFGDFDKSTAKLPCGAQVLNKVTYFSMARELAVKESLREWNTIERLIRVRYPQRAAEIMVAIKNASCPAGIKFDADE